MATITIVYTNGTRAKSFETFDPKVIARYKGYEATDSSIERVEVDE